MVALAAGSTFSLALRADGTVYGWGTGAAVNVPAGLGGIVGLGAGSYHGLAVRSDGTVVACERVGIANALCPMGLTA